MQSPCELIEHYMTVRTTMISHKSYPIAVKLKSG